MEFPESNLHRIIRMLTGILLLIQSVILLFLSSFVLIIVPFVGLLATAAGGAGSEENVWWMILLLAVSPVIITILMIMASIQLLRQKGKLLVGIASVLFLVAYATMVYIMVTPGIAPADQGRELTAAALLPVPAPLAAFFLSLRMNRRNSG